MSTDCDQNKQAELLPCPFCGAGGKHIQVQYMTSPGVYVECFNCDVATGNYSEPYEAIAAWNCRAPAATPDLLSALAAIHELAEELSKEKLSPKAALSVEAIAEMARLAVEGMEAK